MKLFPIKLCCALFFISINCFAQQPVMKLAPADSGKVSLTKLKTKVKVIGNYAVTTMEMEFCNTVPRVLEGELIFPMPEAVSVSRYAIDINGNMREAVPVEKEKGQVAFENTEVRQVDPGLLEKVEGNNFRTRIYPIPANGCRHIIIGYEQLLPNKNLYSFQYLLPLHFKQPIKQFDFSITVASNYIPEVGSDCNTHLKFDELNKVFTSSVSKTDFTPDGSFNIVIPKTPDATEVSMRESNGQYYFLINTFPVEKKVEKKIPDNITIIWDASLSGMRRDHKKEFELLHAYLKAKGNCMVHLYQSGLELNKIGSYTVAGGNWNEIKSKLEAIVYDGATDFNALKFPPGEEYLFFTDGLNTFGDNDKVALPQQPIYTICAAPGADYSQLKMISTRTGGAFINLNELDIATAQKYLTEQALTFIGIKSNGSISEVYPSVPTAVGNNLTITGISNSGNTTVVLQYGYGNKVTHEQSVEMHIGFQNTNFINIEKIWAQKKIAELDMFYDKNEEKINELGKKYSIITRNTSLIVLDQVADYVRYEIEPPAALKEQYDQLIAQQKQTRSNTTKQSIDFAKAYVNELDKWSKEEFKVGPIVKKEMKTEVQNIQRRRPGRRASRSLVPPPPPPAPVYDERVVTAYTGVAMDSARMPSTVRPSMRQQGFATFDPFSADIVLRDRNPVLGEAAGKSGGFDYDGRVVGQDRIVNDGSGKIKMKEVNVVADYLKTINAASKTDRYSAYTKLRTGNELPSFYFNVANAFFKDGDSINGYKILSNIAELDLDDHESYKMLGYRLKNVGRFDDEISMFKKVLDLRPQDPQSYRDYALALEDAGRYQEALNFLYMALTKDFDGQIRSLYRGIEDIIVTEINELIAKHGDKLDISMIPKELIYNIPVDVRVVINWNMNATDIDLWVFDPNDEKVYYGHKLSEIGGRISTDFTQGYGPEQFLLKKAMKGKYKVAINYFGDRQQKLAGPTTVMAEIFTNYGRPAQERQMITLQMKKGSSGEVMVGEFEF